MECFRQPRNQDNTRYEEKIEGCMSVTWILKADHYRKMLLDVGFQTHPEGSFLTSYAMT